MPELYKGTLSSADAAGNRKIVNVWNISALSDLSCLPPADDLVSIPEIKSQKDIVPFLASLPYLDKSGNLKKGLLGGKELYDGLVRISSSPSIGLT